MLKKVLLFLALFTFTCTFTYSCKDPVEPEVPEEPEEPEIPEEPADPKAVELELLITDNWIYESIPSFTVHVKNLNDKPLTAEAKVVVTTDKKKAVTTFTRNIELAASAEQDVVLTLDSALDPGFYIGKCSINGKNALFSMKSSKSSSFVFGISPEKIVSAPDKQPDFDEFWETARAQLPEINDQNVSLTEITTKSSAGCKVYMVEMLSVPDGLTGDPVTVRGYYLEPQDGKPHPVIMHFFGYDSQNVHTKLSCPSGGSNPEYAEFYLSHRGQYINNRDAQYREPDGHGDFKNIYGDWFAYNFGKRDGYYYRGAFMDCVQAVRFMASRPTSDIKNLFGEGSSQGGALSYAAAALSDYPFTAIAPCVAFLGDFPDYFDIVSWPGDTARKNKGSMTNEEMYAFLSYFDTKNLATRISCAVMACSGLQDGTCPPHTNIAPYNNLKSTDKEYYYYPKMQHDIPGDWNSKMNKFFKARIK